MTVQRDFLDGGMKSPQDTDPWATPSSLAILLAQHSNYLADIAMYLRKQNADVLCSAVVRGTSQLTNAITDNNDHEVMFEVGGKPVTIYSLLMFSTYKNDVVFSPLSMASGTDGLVIAASAVPVIIKIPLGSIHLLVPTLANNQCIVNGPADSDNGGFYAYGFTIPDYDRIRGSISS